MRNQKVTLKDLASLLNLSVSTVSKSLLGHSDISEKTKQRVISTAKAMNYQPDLFGKGLRTRKTMTLGVIIPNVVLYFSSTILKGIIDYAKVEGYRVIISESGHHYQDEKNAINTLINSKVDGILLSIARESKDIDHILEASHFTPIVLFDKISYKTPLTKVVVDEETGAFNAVEHLIKQGRKRIVIIKEDSKTSNSENRFKGYKKALEKNGIAVEDVLLKDCHNMSVEDGFSITHELIQQKVPFDALFGTTDNVAVGAIKALKRNHFSIPEDVAVVGFSNSKSSYIIEPNLTTVSQPGYEMGKYAVKYLIEEINEDTSISANKTIELKTKLIIRESSKVKEGIKNE